MDRLELVGVIRALAAERDELAQKLAAMSAERDEYRRMSGGYYNEAATAYEQRDEARRALTASEKDAARYRWLREHRYTDFPGKGNPRFMIGADMDAAIDAAMEKAK
jgi:uncharacterized coiled-coil DUF342 family protein